MSLAIAVAVFFVVNSFIVTSCIVFGNSMEPVLSRDDRLVISPVPYYFSEPKVGDIIVFPNSESDEKYLIKRIMAKGGDVVAIIDSVLYINSDPVYDEYNNVEVYSHGNIDYPLIVPDGSYFVMGDNRSASIDSRYSEVGCVKKERIVGKVLMRIYPFNKIGAL